jgi:hypothetical protein
MSDTEKNCEELTSTIEQALRDAGFEPDRSVLEWYRKVDGLNVSLRGGYRFFLMGGIERLPRLFQAKYNDEDVRTAVREWVEIVNRDMRVGVAEMDGKVEAIRIDPEKVWAFLLSRLEGK